MTKFLFSTILFFSASLAQALNVGPCNLRMYESQVDFFPLGTSFFNQTLYSLRWGMSSADAEAVLAQRGFTTLKRVNGQVKDFLRNDRHGKFDTTTYAGIRLIGQGKVNGLVAEYHFVFGAKNQLSDIFVRIIWKNPSVSHAKKMLETSDVIYKELERNIGGYMVERICDDDTANTVTFTFGSGQIMQYLRGEMGFEFAPSFHTELVVQFSSRPIVF